MSLQTSTSYDVDNRYAQARGAKDNTAGKRFVKEYINKRKAGNRSDTAEQRSEDNRFVMSGPGDQTYGFKNGFRAALFNK
jgi:hypothetical protein